MILKSISTMSCPICGCTEVEFEGVEKDSTGKVWVHANGERREYRAFICGHKVKYNPNFKREEVVGTCQNDENLKKRRAQRAVVQVATLNFIDERDCDDNFKKRLKERVQSTWID